MMEFASLLPLLLALAWLLPLGSFALILVIGPRMGRGGRCAGYVATLAIVSALALSIAALAVWLLHHPLGHETAAAVSGDWYTLGQFGSLRITIGYYIDGLTLVMFSMVTLVASCIHVYSFGYMHEELHPVTDPMVTLADGQTKLTRAGGSTASINTCRFSRSACWAS